MELLEKHEKWKSWLVGCSERFRREWKKVQDDEMEKKLEKLSYFQEHIKKAFGDIIERSEYLIREFKSCGVKWFYQDVLQDNKPSQCVKDCANIVYYDKPQDEKYKGTFIFKLASLIYEKFGFVDGRIYPEHPEPLPENAEQWQVDDWKEEMDDACSGIVWEEELEYDWLVDYILIVALYAALKNEEVLFLVEEGEEAELNGGELVLPEELDTERARKYFPKAIQAGFMEPTENGCRWTFGGNRGKVRLSHFLIKVYCPNVTDTWPLSALENFFNIKRLDSANFSFSGTYKHQKWIPKIDELFED